MNINPNNKTLISVIICTYNRCQSLRNTLKRFQEQDANGSFNYEVIVVDNNSKDRTKEVIEEFYNQMDGKIRYLFERRQGRSFALNKGIKEAKGKIIAFMDDDILVDKNWLNNLYNAFKKHNCDAVQGRVLLYELPPKWMWSRRFKRFIEVDYGETTKKAPVSTGANVAFRSEIFKKFGMFNTSLGSGALGFNEDIEFFRRIRDAAKILYCPEVLVYHVPSPERLTKKYFRRRFYKQGRSDAHMGKISVTLLRYTLYTIKEILKNMIKAIISYYRRNSEERLYYECDAYKKIGFLLQLYKEHKKRIDFKFRLSEVQKILIVATAGMGDAIMFTPTLRMLCKTLNHAKIYLLAKPSIKELMIDSPLIDEIIDYENMDGYIPGFLIEKLQKEQFDLAIFSYPPHEVKLRRHSLGDKVFSWSFPLEHYIKAKYNLGHKFSSQYFKLKGFPGNANTLLRGHKHTIDRNLDLLRIIGLTVKEEDKKLNVDIPAKYQQFAEEFVTRHGLSSNGLIIGIHPGCSSSTKLKYRRWPEERFAELADKLIESFNAKVIIFGGPDELEAGRNISHLMRNKPLDLVGKLTLKNTAVIIKKCSLFISMDSGLIHLATALQVPTIAIFTFTDPVVTGPYNNSHIVIKPKLPCSPCYSSGEGFKEYSCLKHSLRTSNLDCANAVTVNDVFQYVEKRILWVTEK